MSFAINTNVASLQAQEYLRVNSDFQSKTINRVTSGLRIISSGDDAAGLAIANTFRSDQAVLAQGVRNANDGLSQLQIADGGISNISKLLDRARTLATQSASGTFSGGAEGRALLNGEFQAVITEVDRQAKAIGLDQGGTFNTNLSVFIGGGRGSDAAGVITNGSVSVDLSTSAVDSKSLGLQGFAFQGAPVDAAFYAVTGTASVVTFNGPGFDLVNVTVDSSAIDNANELAAALNVSIQAQTVGGTAETEAFKAANIVATANLDGSISFTGSKAFQVTAAAEAGANFGSHILNGSTTASANYGEGTYRIEGKVYATTTAAQIVTFTASGSDGVLHTQAVTIAIGDDIDEVLVTLNTALQTGSNNAALKEIVAVKEDATHVGFTSKQGFNVTYGAVAANGFATAGTTQAAALDTDETGATAQIDTVDAAKAAVTSLAAAVTALGQAQANVGKGQNQFSYAINLASSQLSNLASAESRIRDADLASEAANLTKAQTLLQAGIAALAQANSAPQAVLALLRG